MLKLIAFCASYCDAIFISSMESDRRQVYTLDQNPKLKNFVFPLIVFYHM